MIQTEEGMRGKLITAHVHPPHYKYSLNFALRFKIINFVMIMGSRVGK